MSFNKIPLEDIKIGMSAVYTQTITDADIKAFVGISGDRNPVHLNENYSRQSGFKNRIVHGIFATSFFSTIFGTKIPGEELVCTNQSLNFKKPVYKNDTVVTSIEVVDVDLNSRRVKFKTVCTVNGSIVIDGKIEIYIPMTFRKILINDKNELLKFKEQIFALFKISFDREMDEGLWRWAYIDNPNGNPIVSLYFDGKKLIGHYAFIPMLLVHNQTRINAALSMTTMIDFKYRKYNIFQSQAEDVNKKAVELGYHLVYGFPNKQAAPGLKKRLNWILEENLYVVNFSYNELQRIKKNDCPNVIAFDIQDKKNLDWRLSKPGQCYFNNGYNILKYFGEKIDIIFSDNDFSTLNQNKKYNLLLCCEAGEYLENRDFEYIFGYKLFDSSLEGINFKKDLIMSDVF